MKRSTSPTRVASAKRRMNSSSPSDQTTTRLCTGVRLPTGWLPNPSPPRSNSQYSVSTCLYVCLCTGVRLPTGWLPNPWPPKVKLTVQCKYMSVCLCLSVYSRCEASNRVTPKPLTTQVKQYSVSTVQSKSLCLYVCLCTGVRPPTGWLPNPSPPRSNSQYSVSTCLSLCLSVCRCEASKRVTPKPLTTQVNLTVQCKYLSTFYTCFPG